MTISGNRQIVFLYEFEYNSEIYEGNYNSNEENSLQKGKKLLLLLIQIIRQISY